MEGKKDELYKCEPFSPTLRCVEVDRNRAQKGTPHGMSQSERATSGNNLTSTGNCLKMNLSNSLPISGNHNSTKQTETAKKGHNPIPTAIVMNKNVPTVHLQITTQEEEDYGTVLPLQVILQECILLW